MKRLLTIALLLLFLFNVMGYYAVYVGLRYQAAREMSQRLEAGHYNTDETVTIKIPVAIPYFADQADYERVHGDFEYSGDFYKLVKQKFERDTLYVVCIKDFKEKQLTTVLIDFIKFSNDLPLSSSPAMKLLGGFIKDYTLAPTHNTMAPVGISMPQSAAPQFTFHVAAVCLAVPSPPPDAA